ncbi:armadillo repeat-containing protein 3 isoform X2 [Fundulus heteroclitus]|uniref:armadillo repeat-containing protein 3 isoform X2 n=1 Tax=Fundulus heteroclitus TaxID=8078 RepID=UPI00165B0240|nr:armadillo repeat-containing protein 3 isoform X2 [Fundulus heteroclitus]
MGKKPKKESEAPRKEGFEPLSLESKTPATVVLLLNSQEEDILVKACEAIHTFAEKGDENRVSLLGLGAVEPLCRLIAHSNRLVRRNAFMALGIMATNGDVNNVLKKADAIPSMIQNLTPEEDAVVQEFATLCLASLSADFTCRVQIYANNGMPPVIRLLTSSDPDVTKNSLEIIFNLVQAVHELGGIPSLLELLKSDFPVIQRLALKTLQCVTSDKETRETFREEQGFEKLMDILSNMDLADLHGEALHIVANCLRDGETLQLIHNDGGLARLMDFVLAPSTPAIQSTAVQCLSRVAQSCDADVWRVGEGRSVLHEQEVEKALVELLSAADDDVKASACQAVAAMSFHPASKDSFRDWGGLPAVAQLLNGESSALREAATQALSSLTHGSQANALAAYEAGAHEVLIQQLCGSSARTVANSAAALCNMAEQEIIQSSILSHGGIEALVEPLRSNDAQVLINTTLCVAVLACDNEARAKFHKAGGLEPLVALLHSNDKEVLQNACFAVDVCAGETSCAVEMCRLGALQILQQINESGNRRTSFSELAMTSLLNTNLPVKYSLTGHLASTDIITSGFYDAGKVCLGQTVLTLEELSKQPVNQNRAIIVVDIATEETVDLPEDTPPSLSEAELGIKRGGKSTPKKKKEKEKQYEEAQESPPEKQQNMDGHKEDVYLQMLIREAKESVLPLKDEQEQYAALARLVSKAMGGVVAAEKLHQFQWVLHHSELKFQLKSNVIPIGLINKGIYCHRALLFKCLADCIEKSCTLVRGEYNRAWNEVVLFGEDPDNQRSPQPRRYIVDLMHQPGTLLPVDTPAAALYQTI